MPPPWCDWIIAPAMQPRKTPITKLIITCCRTCGTDTQAGSLQAETVLCRFGKSGLSPAARFGTLGQMGKTTAPRRPMGVRLLVAFFSFGVLACTVTIVALFAGDPLALVWRLNPSAREGFAELGVRWSVLLMTIVGCACGAAAYGLARGRAWGRGMAIGILLVNLLGDCVTASVRHDPRTLIGLPIGGAMVFYLWRIKA